MVFILFEQLTRATTNACKTNLWSYQPQICEALVGFLVDVVYHVEEQCIPPTTKTRVWQHKIEVEHNDRNAAHAGCKAN